MIKAHQEKFTPQSDQFTDGSNYKSGYFPWRVGDLNSTNTLMAGSCTTEMSPLNLDLKTKGAHAQENIKLQGTENPLYKRLL